MPTAQQVYAAIQADSAAKTAFDAGDESGTLAALNAQSVTSQNTQKWMAYEAVPFLGDADSRTVLATFQAASDSDPLARAYLDQLRSTGVPLNSDRAQAFIDSLAAAGRWPAELTAKVKALGRTITSPAQQGWGADATAADVTAAVAYAAWITLTQDWATELNENLQPLLNDETTTRTQLVTAIRAAADTIEAG